MAGFRPLSHQRTPAVEKSQPERLGRQGHTRRCDWAAGCLAGAVSEYKDHVYCASHLLRTLQQQWQGG